MARERMKMKKIDDPASRQLTFSKRRRGLFKKAEELSVLCDAEVALLIFSNTGKLFEYSSSSSTKSIISRYDQRSNNNGKPGNQLPPLHPQPVSSDRIIGTSERAESNSSKQRKVREEDIQGLNLEELHKLEKIIQVGLNRVTETKEERIMGELATLRQKTDRLTEANVHLKKKMVLLSQLKRGGALDQSRDSIPEEGSVNIAPSAPPPPLEATSSDTSLKLGLPFSN